mgnify:CR=1 FL=1
MSPGLTLLATPRSPDTANAGRIAGPRPGPRPHPVRRGFLSMTRHAGTNPFDADLPTDWDPLVDPWPASSAVSEATPLERTVRDEVDPLGLSYSARAWTLSSAADCPGPCHRGPNPCRADWTRRAGRPARRRSRRSAAASASARSSWWSSGCWRERQAGQKPSRRLTATPGSSAASQAPDPPSPHLRSIRSRRRPCIRTAGRTARCRRLSARRVWQHSS